MSEIVINQTTINEEKINKEFLKNTPFCLTKGSIDELTLQMSISKIFKEPIKVAAKNIYLELCLNHKQNYFDFLKKISTRNKLKRQNYEQQNKLKQEEIVQDEEKINDYFKKIILKTQVKFENIVIKLNFSKEHASKENSVFMLFKLQKLKTIKTLPNQQDQLKKSLIIQDPHNQSFQNSMSYQFSQSKMGTYQDLGDNQGAEQYNLYKLNLQFEQFTVHIMKDSNPNIVNEYKNNLNYQFPFTYPHHLHPSTILYLERMEMNGEQTIDTGETHVAIKFRAIELILEPYQLKILLDYIVELRKWKQKQDIYEKIRKNQKIMQKSSQDELKIKRFSSKKQASNQNNIKQKIQEESEHSDSDNDSIENNKNNSQTEIDDKSELDLQTQNNKENKNGEIQQDNENIENIKDKENKQDQEFNEQKQNEENQNIGEIQNEVNKQNKQQNFENQEEEEQQEEQQLNSNKVSYKNRRRLSSQDFDLEENVPVEERHRIFKGLLSEFQNQIQELDTNDLEYQKSIYQFEQSFQQSFVFHQNGENYQPNFIVNTEVDIFIVQLLKEDIYIQQGGDDLKEYARDWISCKKNTNSSSSTSSKKSQGISTNVPVSYFLLKIKTMSLGLARRQVRLDIQQCIKLLDIDLVQMNTKHFSQRGQIIPKKERQDQETNENNNNNQQQQSNQNQEQEKEQEQFIYTSSFQRIKKNLPITLLPMSGQGSHYCVKYIFKIQNNRRQSNFPSQQMNPKDIIKTQQKIKKHNLFKTSRQLQYKYDFQMGEGFQQTRFYKKQSENMDKIKKIINNDTQAQAMQPVALTLQIETSQIQGQKTQNTQVSTGMVNMNLDTIFLKEMKMIFDGHSYRGQQLHAQVDKKHIYKDFLWETYQEEDENYQKDQYIFELGEKLSKIKLIDENEEEDKHAKEKFIQSLKDEKVLQEVSIFIPFSRIALLTPLKQIQKETQENQKNEEYKKEQLQNQGEEEELGIEIELESDFSNENKENEFLKKEKEKKMNQIFENFELNQQGKCRCLCNIKAAEKNQNHQNSDFLYHNINVNTNLRANRDIYKYDRNCLFFDLTDFTIDSSKSKEFNFYFCFLEGYLAELNDDNNQQFLTQKIFSIGKNYINKKQVENSFTFKLIQNNKIIENQQLIKKLPDNSFSNLEDMDKFFSQFQKQNIAQSETSLNSDQEDKKDNNEKNLQQNYNQEKQNIQNMQILSNKIDQKNEIGDQSNKNNSNNNINKNNYKGGDSNSNKNINKDNNLKNEVQNNLNQHFSMELRLGILQLFLTTKKSWKNLKECIDGNLEMMNNMDQFEFFKKAINNQDLVREIKKKVFDIDLFVAESNIFYQLEENDKQQQHSSRQRANSVAKSGVKNKSDNKNLNYQQPKINQLINFHCREIQLELVFKQQIEEKYLECEKSVFQVLDFQNFNIYEILLIDPLANKKVLGVPDKLNDQFQVHKQVYNLDTYFLNSYHSWDLIAYKIKDNTNKRRYGLNQIVQNQNSFAYDQNQKSIINVKQTYLKESQNVFNSNFQIYQQVIKKNMFNFDCYEMIDINLKKVCLQRMLIRFSNFRFIQLIHNLLEKQEFLDDKKQKTHHQQQYKQGQFQQNENNSLKKQNRKQVNYSIQEIYLRNIGMDIWLKEQFKIFQEDFNLFFQYLVNFEVYYDKIKNLDQYFLSDCRSVLVFKNILINQESLIKNNLQGNLNFYQSDNDYLISQFVQNNENSIQEGNKNISNDNQQQEYEDIEDLDLEKSQYFLERTLFEMPKNKKKNLFIQIDQVEGFFVQHFDGYQCSNLILLLDECFQNLDYQFFGSKLQTFSQGNGNFKFSNMVSSPKFNTNSNNNLLNNGNNNILQNQNNQQESSKCHNFQNFLFQFEDSLLQSLGFVRIFNLNKISFKQTFKEFEQQNNQSNIQKFYSCINSIQSNTSLNLSQLEKEKYLETINFDIEYIEISVCRDSLYQLNRQIQLFKLNIERLMQDVKGLQEFIKKAQQVVQSKVDEFLGQQVSEENEKLTNKQNQNFKETSRFFQENHKNLQNQFSNNTINKQEQQPYKKTNMYDSIEVYEQNNEYFKENQKIQKKLNIHVNQLTINLYDGLDFDFLNQDKIRKLEQESSFLREKQEFELQKSELQKEFQFIQLNTEEDEDSQNNSSPQKNLNLFYKNDYFAEQEDDIDDQTENSNNSNKEKKKFEVNFSKTQHQKAVFILNSTNQKNMLRKRKEKRDNQNKIQISLQNFQICLDLMQKESIRDLNLKLILEELEVYDNPKWSNIHKILKKKNANQNENFLEIFLQLDKKQIMKGEKSGGPQNNDQKEIQYTQNIDELVINVNQNLELFLNSNTLEFLLMFSEYNEQIQKKMYTQENIEIVKKQFQYLYLIQQQRDKNFDQFELEDFNIIDESQKIQKFIKLFIMSRFEIDIYNDQEKLNLEYFWDSENQKKKYVQLVNLGDIQGLKVRLGEFLFEKDSLQNLQQKLKEHYKKELENQKWEIIGKLPLVKNFKNVLGGFYGLIKEPFTSYVNGEDIWQGTIKGVKNFAVSIGEESINLTETLFNSVSSVFQLFGKKEEQHHNITRKY